MDPVQLPGTTFALAKHFRICGWTWGDQVLSVVLRDLADGDVCVPRALVGLCLHEVDGVDNWPPEVIDFVQKVVRFAARKTFPFCVVGVARPLLRDTARRSHRRRVPSQRCPCLAQGRARDLGLPKQ
jgi:hypothetical protein